MARLERPQTANANPSKKFLQWKSEKKNFAYWDKDKEENVTLELPLKFLFLEHYHTVKGWHGATDKGIVSNEVYALGSEPLKVRTFAGLEIAEGIYKDIKEKVNVSGGVYHRSVYVMLEDGTIANLQLKGAVVGGLKPEQSVNKILVDGYSEFYNKNKNLLDSQWIEVNSFEDAKKGATKYSIPVFSLGSAIDSETNDMANDCAKELQEYVNQYKGAKTEVKDEVSEEDFKGDEGDLEF
jgi:hypothetical protein